MGVETDRVTSNQKVTAITTALTFDDVLLTPRHSTVLPSAVDISSRLTRNISLNVPLLSSAMDTVTESGMAIAMAQLGGIGIIHKNLDIPTQAAEVDRVKRSESGMIVNPITLSPQASVFQALELMKKYRISGVPITADGRNEGHLVGILTNRDLRFQRDIDRPILEVMTREELITVPVGTTLDQAKEILHQHRVEKLLVVDDDFNLRGLITVKDIQKAIKYPSASKDHLGRLRVGAAVGIAADTMERAEALVAANVDVLVLDSAHGHSQNVLDMARQIRQAFPDIDLIAGNVATKAGTKALIEVGVDAVKVGIGSGSICTTRIIAGIGVPMVTAIMDCYFQEEFDLNSHPDDQNQKLVPEGIEGRVPYKGSVAAMIHQLVGGLRAGMGYCGAPTIPTLQRDAELIRITPAGAQESHVHNVVITKEAPNYRSE